MDIFIGKDSEYKTIKEFLNNLQSLNGEITVHLAEEEYVLDESMIFTPENTKGKKLIFKGENNTVISCGVRVTNWKKEENSNLWYAFAPINDFRRLYVNKKAAQRARTEKKIEGISACKGEYSNCDGIVISPEKFGEYTNVEDIELVWEKAEWRHFRHGVECVKTGEDGNKYVYMKQPYYAWGTNISSASNLDPSGLMIYTPVHFNPFWIENAKELLTKPGQWYLDKKTKIIYYMPKDNEDMETAEVIAPNVEQPVIIYGKGNDNKVQNIEFHNIKFCYSAWNRPTHKGFASVQAQMLNSSPEPQSKSVKEYVDGAIELNFAEKILFENCEFYNIGCDAIRFINGVCYTIIKNCVFKNISGGALQIGLPEHQEDVNKNCNVCSNNLIESNIIEHIGEEFPCMPAILLYYPNSTVIKGNDIGFVPYTGISMGWGWTKKIENVVNGDNVIENNAIHDFMCIGKDGGAIYTLGRQYNNIIRYNYFYNEVNYHASIYTDNGSENIEIYGNVNENVVKFEFSWEPSIQNIRVHDNYTDTMCSLMWARNSYTKNNTFFKRGHMCDEAKQIAEKAGVIKRKFIGSGEGFKFDSFPLMEDDNSLTWYENVGRYANGMLYHIGKKIKASALSLVIAPDVQSRSIHIYIPDEKLEYKKILSVQYVGSTYSVIFDEPVITDKFMFVFEADDWKRGFMPIEDIEII